MSVCYEELSLHLSNYLDYELQQRCTRHRVFSKGWFKTYFNKWSKKTIMVYVKEAHLQETLELVKERFFIHTGKRVTQAVNITVHVVNKLPVGIRGEYIALFFDAVSNVHAVFYETE
jgi:hypothetical protein